MTGVVSALSLPAIIVDNSFSVVLSTTADTTFSEVLPLIVAQIAAGRPCRHTSPKAPPEP